MSWWNLRQNENNVKLCRKTLRIFILIPIHFLNPGIRLLCIPCLRLARISLSTYLQYKSPHLSSSESTDCFVVGGMINLLIVAAVREPLRSAWQQSHCLPRYTEYEEESHCTDNTYIVYSAAGSSFLYPLLCVSSLSFHCCLDWGGCLGKRSWVK